MGLEEILLLMGVHSVLGGACTYAAIESALNGNYKIAAISGAGSLLNIFTSTLHAASIADLQRPDGKEQLKEKIRDMLAEIMSAREYAISFLSADIESEVSPVDVNTFLAYTNSLAELNGAFRAFRHLYGDEMAEAERINTKQLRELQDYFSGIRQE